MKKTLMRLGIGALLTANALILSEAVLPFTGFALAAEPAKVAEPTEAKSIQGKIANISQKAKTLALATSDGGFFLMKFTDDTILKGVSSAAEFKEEEAVVALYTTVNGENIATSLEKDVVKLPEGVKEVKTDELVKLMANDKNIVVIDARPAIKYDEGHIPGSISIPFATLVTMGEEGTKLFGPYQGNHLVFYCGGPT
jgi:predicted sulfurtransferase